jgi:DNA-binding transcriptional ArsR family regulator
VFNAVAEPRRRQILDVLVGGEQPVNDLVARLGLAQPQVSKHLRVLREVGLVEVRDLGRQRVYRLNGQGLKPIHDWVKNYEQTWSRRFELMDVVLAELKDAELQDEERRQSEHPSAEHIDTEPTDTEQTGTEHIDTEHIDMEDDDDGGNP